MRTGACKGQRLKDAVSGSWHRGILRTKLSPAPGTEAWRAAGEEGKDRLELMVKLHTELIQNCVVPAQKRPARSKLPSPSLRGRSLLSLHSTQYTLRCACNWMFALRRQAQALVRAAKSTNYTQPSVSIYCFPYQTRAMATENPAKKLKMDGPQIGTHK